MELRQLRYFTAVAEELSYSRAAARIHVSQPSLSRQVAALEAEIGVALLDRDKHRVSLTAAGQAYLDGVRELLAGLDQTADLARRTAQGQVGRLALGFGGSAAYTLMPAVLRRFRARYPEVEVTLQQLPLTAQLDALRDGRVDVGFLLLPVDDAAVRTERLMRDRMVAAVPSDHALARRREVALRSLSEEAFVAFPREGGLGYRDRMVELCLKAGFTPRIVREAAPLESIVGFVASGAGIALLPAMAQRLRVADVLYVPISERYAYMDFALAWREAGKSPALEAFLTQAREVAREAGVNQPTNRARGRIR